MITYNAVDEFNTPWEDQVALFEDSTLGFEEEEDGPAIADAAGYEEGYYRAYYLTQYNAHCKTHGFSGTALVFATPAATVRERYKDYDWHFMQGFGRGIQAYCRTHNIPH